MTQNLDQTDKKILNLLQNNGQLSVKEVASQINLSVTPTYERIKRLEKNGIIDKYIAILSKEKIDKGLTVFCNVVLKENNEKLLKEFEESVKKIEEIMEVHCMSGVYDYLLKVVVSDMKDYHHFVITKLSDLKNIQNLQSSFVLSEIKYETCFQLK
jgi:DNA-binding Lrp family transcriptional regulator